MNNPKETRAEEKPQQTALQNTAGGPSVRFDWRDWLPYIEEADIPDEQKREFIETLAAIVLGFVDLGFGICDGLETCGEDIDLKAILQAAVVNSGEQSQSTFNQSGDVPCKPPFRRGRS